MSDDEKQKPDEFDGWIAWHPNAEEYWHTQILNNACDYCDVIHPTFDGALNELKDELKEEFDTHNCAGDVRLNLGREIVPWLKDRGWRIRPVKLVFLDEEGI